MGDVIDLETKRKAVSLEAALMAELRENTAALRELAAAMREASVPWHVRKSLRMQAQIDAARERNYRETGKVW